MPNHEPTPRWTIRRQLAVAAFSVLLAVISGVGNLLPGSSGTAPAEASPAQEPGVTRYFGRGAFEGIRRAVTDTPRSCDVSDDHLTAMVMAPIFKEVSMAETPDAVPSPMTLSRYDEWTGNRSGSNNLHANYGLYPFWDPHGTPFKRAFWHPGIGIFQYDSAGVGANFTAAERINTEFVTRDVVRGIADRYCAAGGSDAQRRAAAWQPWAVLGGVAKSEALFHEMVGAGVEPFSRIGLVDGVENAGGMEQRTCEVGGETVECFYVDPARSQGANWWATRNPDGGSVTSGESPLSAPFYVLRRGDFEERHWLAADTGYPIDLSARRLLGQNARPRDGEPQSGLQWFDSSDLCDTARPETGCPVPPPEEPEPAVEETSEENEQKGSEQADQGERRALRGKGDAAPAGDTARHAEIAVAADAEAVAAAAESVRVRAEAAAAEAKAAKAEARVRSAHAAAQSASHRAEVAKARVPGAEAAAKKAAARLEAATRPGGAKAAASPAQADAATVSAPAETPDEAAPRLGVSLRGMRYLDDLELEARVGSAQAGLARARQAAKDAIDRRNALQAKAEEAEAAAEDAVAAADELIDKAKEAAASADELAREADEAAIAAWESHEAETGGRASAGDTVHRELFRRGETALIGRALESLLVVDGVDGLQLGADTDE